MAFLAAGASWAYTLGDLLRESFQKWAYSARLRDAMSSESGRRQSVTKERDFAGAMLPLSVMYVIAVFFPYVGPVPFRSDVQPYAVGLATLVLLFSPDRRIPKLICYLLIPVAVAFFFLVTSQFSLYSLRSFLSYWSLFVHAAAGYIVFRRHRNAVIRCLLVAVWIWLGIALIQQFVSPTFTQVLIPNLSTSSSRGVTSLATEPSFYGLSAFFLLVLATMVAVDGPWLRSSLFAQIVLLARSGMGILALAIFFLARRLGGRRLFGGILVVAVIVAAVILGVEYIPSNSHIRALFLLRAALSHPMSLFLTDKSVNARVDYLIFSLRGFVDGFGVPHGFNTFSAYVEKVTAKDPNWVWIGKDPTDMRIMSGYGSALFELGWFGMIIPLVLTVCVWRRFKHSGKEFLSVAVPLNAVLFSAVQLSLPIIGFMAGICLAYCRLPEAANREPPQANQPSAPMPPPRTEAHALGPGASTSG